MQYPPLFRLRQTFDATRVDNIPATVDSELGRLNLAKKIKPGQTVAITAGSRGIANIAIIVRAVVQHLQRLGAKPFVVPAMGSHGGGTVEGQTGILAGYGITEAFVGCPIRATMETVVVCDTAEGFPVHFDKHAFEADHVLVCGRVKPHTAFFGEVESGLMKMMLIGLGKHNGAIVYHRAIQNYSFEQIIHSVAGRVLEKCRIVGGLGIVENAYDETALIQAVEPSEFYERERELLQKARAWLPRLPFENIDVLFIDEIGKNISGAGMDTNVIGRKNKQLTDGNPNWRSPVKRIIVRSITEASHGNGLGIGMADYALTRTVEQIDRRITAINCITGGHPEAARIPLHYATDRETLDAALATIGLVDPPDARIVWIRNTLELVEVEVSAAYLDEARRRSDLEILTDPRPIPFDADGNLPKTVEEYGQHVATV